MHIYVIDLKKHKATYATVCILLAFVILCSISISVLTKIYRNDLFITAADAIPYDKIIIIDAGHGGEDSGAVGVNGVLEKDLNLEYALQIGAMLEEKGYIIVYTRTDDRLLYTDEEDIKGIRKISDLKNRVKVADRYPEAIYLSIHMNSFGDSKYSGLQVYYSDNDGSNVLANKIQNRVKNDIQQSNNRVVKQGKDIYILENVSNCAVLVECGFLTNKNECEKLSEKEYQKQLCFSIVCGIIEYKEK